MKLKKVECMKRNWIKIEWNSNLKDTNKKDRTNMKWEWPWLAEAMKK